jgi:stearoyl-CoA desaturase (delta-9 desaturase)
LLADSDIAGVNRQFPAWTVVSLAAPALLGGVLTWSWWGALTAFFWAGLVRIGSCTTSPGRAIRSAT